MNRGGIFLEVSAVVISAQAKPGIMFLLSSEQLRVRIWDLVSIYALGTDGGVSEGFELPIPVSRHRNSGECAPLASGIHYKALKWVWKVNTSHHH